MATLKLPALLKYYVDNRSEVELNGETLADALTDLTTRYPTFKTHLVDSSGNLRRHVNFFVNEQNIKDLNGLQTALSPEDKIILIQSISGG